MPAAGRVVPGLGVAARRWLGATGPTVGGGPGDTPVFELAGPKPGGTMMILGGTHPQEIGGVLAAVLMIENARVKQGRPIIVPQANRSGFTHTDPMEAYLHSFTIDTPAGPRSFPVRAVPPPPPRPSSVSDLFRRL